MAGPLADLLFFLALLAIAVAHTFIIRSTMRGLRASAAHVSRAREIVWAVLPALALVALLMWTWATMHPATIRVRMPPGGPPPGGITT